VATGGRPAELARLNVDVIVTGGTHASFAAAKVTTTIPIVFVGVAGPLEAGLVTRLARPGGNITGLSFDVTPETVAKGLELFKEVAPKAARLGHLVNPNNPFFSLYIRFVEIGAQAFREAGQHVRRELGLEDITQGPGSERSIHVVRVRVHGQEHDPRRGARRLEFPGCLDAVQHGHGDVEHDHVGLEPRGFVHQRLPVANGLEHLEVRFEMSSNGSEKVTMVIGQEYAHADGSRSWSIRGPNTR